MSSVMTFTPDDFILDPGIERAVRLLQQHDIYTYESCQSGSGHCFPEPTVYFKGSQAEAWRALSVCLAFGLPVNTLSQFWRMDDGVPTGPSWAITFTQSLEPLTENDPQLRGWEPPQ